MTQKTPRLVSAEVILVSKTGKSLARPETAITAKNVEDYTPTKQTIQNATRLLQNFGFTVTPSELTITITGHPRTFEEVFHCSLTLKNGEIPGSTAVTSDSELEIPDILKQYVDKIVFPEAPEYFG